MSTCGRTQIKYMNNSVFVFLKLFFVNIVGVEGMGSVREAGNTEV